MKPFHAQFAAPWTTGTLVGFLGVGVARLVAPLFADPVHTGLAVVGQFVGLAGLLIIALGVRRRLNAPAPERDPVP